MFFRVQKQKKALVEHPEAWVRIVCISNISAGKKSKEEIERVAIEASAQNADIVLLCGGVVVGAADTIRDAQPLAQIRAHLGHYFVLGEGDLQDNPTEVRSTLSSYGFRDVTNVACTMRKHGRAFRVTGIDDAARGVPLDPSEAVEHSTPHVIMTSRERNIDGWVADMIVSGDAKRAIRVIELGI